MGYQQVREATRCALQDCVELSSNGRVRRQTLGYVRRLRDPSTDPECQNWPRHPQLNLPIADRTISNAQHFETRVLNCAGSPLLAHLQTPFLCVSSDCKEKAMSFSVVYKYESPGPSINSSSCSRHSISAAVKVPKHGSSSFISPEPRRMWRLGDSDQALYIVSAIVRTQRTCNSERLIIYLPLHSSVRIACRFSLTRHSMPSHSDHYRDELVR